MALSLYIIILFMGYHKVFLSDRLEDLIKAGDIEAENLIVDLLEKHFSNETKHGSQGPINAADEAERAARRASREESRIRAEVRESELEERRSKQEEAWNRLIYEYEKEGAKTEQGRNIITAIKETEEHIRRLEQTGKMMEGIVEETEMIVKRTAHATRKGEGAVKETEEATKETEKAGED